MIDLVQPVEGAVTAAVEPEAPSEFLEVLPEIGLAEKVAVPEKAAG